MKLLKFSNKIEYLEDLQQGKLFMNGINYFRKLEKEEQGDKNDGILCIDNTLLTIENKDETFTFKTSECKIALTENYPIFCMSAIEDDLLNKKYYEMFKKYFGCYFFLFENPLTFIESFNHFCENNNYAYMLGPITYIDKNFSLSKKDFDEIYFRKDIHYSYQNEFRLLIQESNLINSKGYAFINLGMSYKGHLYKIDTNNELKLLKIY